MPRPHGGRGPRADGRDPPLAARARNVGGAPAHGRTQATSSTHRAAQRLLRPLAVVNPFAEQLTFLDDRTRTRRDHMKYLALIRCIALLHQYQRPVRTVEREGRQLEYIEATLGRHRRGQRPRARSTRALSRRNASADPAAPGAFGEDGGRGLRGAQV